MLFEIMEEYDKNRLKLKFQAVHICGAGERTRTPDLRITNVYFNVLRGLIKFNKPRCYAVLCVFHSAEFSELSDNIAAILSEILSEIFAVTCVKNIVRNW